MNLISSVHACIHLSRNQENKDESHLKSEMLHLSLTLQKESIKRRNDILLFFFFHNSNTKHSHLKLYLSGPHRAASPKDQGMYISPSIICHEKNHFRHLDEPEVHCPIYEVKSKKQSTKLTVAPLLPSHEL